MGAGSERVTNLDYLNGLAKGNPKFVRDMIAIFLEENPAEVEMLRQGVSNGDMELIRTSAHKLRSTIAFVGIDRFIEDDVAEAEQLAYEAGKQKTVEPEKALVRIRDLFDRIARYCDMACRELESA